MPQLIIFLIIGLAGIFVGRLLAVRRKVKVSPAKLRRGASGSASERRQEREKNLLNLMLISKPSKKYFSIPS